MRSDAMGEINEYMVLEYLREHLEATRPVLAEALKLSPASVSRIVARLLDKGLVHETSPVAPSGPGRPSMVLQLVLDRIAVIGIDLGGTNCHGALSSLDGNIIEESRVAVRDAENAFDALARVWTRLSAEVAARSLAVGALAVGVPAVIDPDTRLASRGPNVGWENFDLTANIRAFGVPFVVDNDVNLAAIAEGEVGRAVGLRDYVLLSIGTGLGGAVVSDGRLTRGRHNAAGEIASMIPNPSLLRDSRTGTIGGLETILSGAAITARARDLVRDDPAARAELGTEPLPRDVIEAAAAKKPAGTSIVRDVLDALAVAVINVASLVDPEVVVIDGSVGRSLAPFFDEVHEIVSRHILTPPRLTSSALGPNSTVRGAISVAIRHFRQLDAPSLPHPLTPEGERR